MGVRGIGGQDPAALFAPLARAPAPRPRAAEAGRDASIPAARAGPEPGDEQVRQAVSTVQKLVHRSGTRLRIDEASKRVVAQIVDQNNQIIKQIPPEELLRIAARFRELRGKLFDVQV